MLQLPLLLLLVVLLLWVLSKHQTNPSVLQMQTAAAAVRAAVRVVSPAQLIVVVGMRGPKMQRDLVQMQHTLGQIRPAKH
jgi:hypothetical protein